MHAEKKPHMDIKMEMPFSFSSHTYRPNQQVGTNIRCPILQAVCLAQPLCASQHLLMIQQPAYLDIRRGKNPPIANHDLLSMPRPHTAPSLSLFHLLIKLRKNKWGRAHRTSPALVDTWGHGWPQLSSACLVFLLTYLNSPWNVKKY